MVALARGNPERRPGQMAALAGVAGITMVYPRQSLEGRSLLTVRALTVRALTEGAPDWMRIMTAAQQQLLIIVMKDYDAASPPDESVDFQKLLADFQKLAAENMPPCLDDITADDPASLTNQALHTADELRQRMIGRWAERWVYQLLQALRERGHIERVTWINENKESEKPYDIVVVLPDGEQEFWEVKSTTAMKNKNAVFHVSWPQARKAITTSKYTFALVYQAGCEDARLEYRGYHGLDLTCTANDKMHMEHVHFTDM
eukprot:gene3536-4458_t